MAFSMLIQGSQTSPHQSLGRTEPCSRVRWMSCLLAVPASAQPKDYGANRGPSACRGAHLQAALHTTLFPTSLQSVAREASNSSSSAHGLSHCALEPDAGSHVAVIPSRSHMPNRLLRCATKSRLCSRVMPCPHEPVETCAADNLGRAS